MSSIKANYNSRYSITFKKFKLSSEFINPRLNQSQFTQLFLRLLSLHPI